jgi:hypothetical protein
MERCCVPRQRAEFCGRGDVACVRRKGWLESAPGGNESGNPFTGGNFFSGLLQVDCNEVENEVGGIGRRGARKTERLEVRERVGPLA